MAVISMPPRGHYLAWEVGQLAGVSGQTIGQWARNGYIDSSQSNGPPRIYSYQDVAESMVVHELRERGVSYRDIRKTIEQLREERGAWPLVHAREELVTTPPKEGRRAAVLVQRGKAHYDLAGGAWQQVIGGSDLQRIAEDLRRGGWAVRDVPELHHIEVDPDRLSGRPVIRGRRIAARDVADLASAPGGVDLLRDDYDLADDEIEDAVRWWRQTLEYEAA